MPFKMILKELMDTVPGATGAILADWEGEAVEQCCCYDVYELKVIGAHKGILLNMMKEMHQKLAVGDIRHTVISTAAQHFLVGPIGPDYLLVMTLARGTVVGLAVRRFESALERMHKEIY